MIEINAKLKQWGRSFGIVIPMDKIKRENLSEKDELKILIVKKKNPLKEHFGSFKFKRSTEEILKEGDKESWDE